MRNFTIATVQYRARGSARPAPVGSEPLGRGTGQHLVMTPTSRRPAQPARVVLQVLDCEACSGRRSGQGLVGVTTFLPQISDLVH